MVRLRSQVPLPPAQSRQAPEPVPSSRASVHLPLPPRREPNRPAAIPSCLRASSARHPHRRQSRSSLPLTRSVEANTNTSQIMSGCSWTALMNPTTRRPRHHRLSCPTSWRVPVLAPVGLSSVVAPSSKPSHATFDRKGASRAAGGQARPPYCGQPTSSTSSPASSVTPERRLPRRRAPSRKAQQTAPTRPADSSASWQPQMTAPSAFWLRRSRPSAAGSRARCTFTPRS